MRIVAALHENLGSFNQLHTGSSGDAKDVRLYVMADTMYGNCCVDEVGVSHANADCVIHYGHTCVSPTSTLPAFLVLGKASLNVPLCAQKLCEYSRQSGKPILEKGQEASNLCPTLGKKECLDNMSFRMEFQNREIDSIMANCQIWKSISLRDMLCRKATIIILSRENAGKQAALLHQKNSGKQANTTASLWLSPVRTMMNEALGMTSSHAKHRGGVIYLEKLYASPGEDCTEHV